MRSRSRSTISRTATLCTRPAESFGRTLRHKSGRDLVAVQAVEDAAGFLGADQAVVDVAGRLDRLLDRVLGDLVEHQAVDRHLRLEQLEQVPADGLSLAVFVRREVQRVGLLELVLEQLDLLALAGRTT